MYELLSTPGSGGAIVELTLTLCNAPYRVTEATPWENGPHLERLCRLNPLGQVPVLILPDGSVMTESGAITEYLSERYPEARLSPVPDNPLRSVYLRWLFFLTASIYSTFRYADFPERWVNGEEPQAELRERVIDARKQMLLQLEHAASAPYFLGPHRTVIDIYVAVMRYWRPRQAWFNDNCPKLTAIGLTLEGDPRLAHLFDRHFGAAV